MSLHLLDTTVLIDAERDPVVNAGRPRGAHDLIIAATAVAGGRNVVTADPTGVDDLPGVDVRHHS